MLAAGVVVITLFTGNTIRELGAKPKEHCSIAPMQTCIAIDYCLRLTGFTVINQAGDKNTDALNNCEWDRCK
jgi:hypothetical protein